MPTKRFWKRLAIGTWSDRGRWSLDHECILCLAGGAPAAGQSSRDPHAAGEPASIAEAVCRTQLPDDEERGRDSRTYAAASWMPSTRSIGSFTHSASGDALEKRRGCRGNRRRRNNLRRCTTMLNKYAAIVQPALAAASACDKYASQLDFTLASGAIHGSSCWPHHRIRDARDYAGCGR